jgi:hypothetical protein
MINYFSEATTLNALHDYADTVNVHYFSYEGMKGFEGLIFYCVNHPEFELEIVCAYLDYILFGEVDYPKLPESV